MTITDLFWRLRSKVEEILDKIPDPKQYFFDKKIHQALNDEDNICKICFPNEDSPPFIPDDIRDAKLKQDIIEYDIKLTNVRPDQFKIVGRNLLNMAYADPQFGKDDDDDTDDEDPLPPPPEPSEHMKSLKGPLVSINVKGLRVPQLRDLGDMFYDVADYFDMKYEDVLKEAEPGHYNSTEEEMELIDEMMFNPAEKLAEEVQVRRQITNADLIPGLEPAPYTDDLDDWIKSVEKLPQ